MRTVSCGLPVSGRYRSLLRRLTGYYSSMLLMIDRILKTFLWYDTIVNAVQLEIKKINLKAYFQGVITMYPPTLS